MTEETESFPKTVLVLGAGASDDCNFPLGEKLIDQIIQFNFANTSMIRRIIFNARRWVIENNLNDFLPNEISGNLDESNVGKYWELDDKVFTSWLHDLASFRSIDEFIYHKKKYSLLAKLSIVLTLSKHEDPAFFNAGPQGINRIWYRKLWDNLKSPTISGLKKNLSNLHIVNFNYDRSLEFYIQKSISSVYDDMLGRLPITNVYGSIGSLVQGDQVPTGLYSNPYRPLTLSAPPKESRFRVSGGTIYAFESDEWFQFRLFDRHLLELANRIETYASEYNQEKAEKIQKYVFNAEQVYFFGFSFLEQNMKILFGQLQKDERRQRIVDGTFYKIPEQLKSHLVGEFSNRFLYRPLIKNEKKIDGFFEDYSVRV